MKNITEMTESELRDAERAAFAEMELRIKELHESKMNMDHARDKWAEYYGVVRRLPAPVEASHA
jgi:hypothetical protein